MARFVTELLETRSTHLADVEPSPPGVRERLLLRADLTGTMQCYELEPGGAPRPLTALGEPVGAARYLPGQRRAVLEIDRGGNERHQLYLLALDRDAPARDLGELEALTSDERFGHHLAGIAPDGSALAYVSNRRNGVDFDLWLLTLPTGEHRLLYGGGGWCQPAGGFSPDGATVAVARPGPRPLDRDLLLVDVASGAVELVAPHPDEAAEVDGPAWIDTGHYYLTHNVGRDFRAVHRSAPDGTTTPVPGTGEGADAEVVTSGDGSTLLVIENRDGASQLRIVAPDGGTLEQVVLPEAGVVASHALAAPRLSRDGRRRYFTLSTPRLAGDVFLHEAGAPAPVRLTTSPAPVGPEALATPSAHTITSFDGEQLPLFCYRPAGVETPPVVVLVHGGPEGQSVLAFNPVIQGLVSAGYAVVVPNVRGSTGYGKRYASLDDTTRRLDSVADLAAVHGWLAGAGLDGGRAALWGGSYGGYMVLAGLAFQPALWAAGVDIVGISDLVTFLENTSDYRRAHREREYGSLRADRAFLEHASPLRHVDQMRAPLFIIHGRNDPRVPVSEAEQLAASLRQRAVRCELTIYEDEGHGLARLANRLDAYPRAVAFLDEVLALPERAGR